MAWMPNPKEIEAVLRLGDADRYSYLIKKVVDQEELWSLWEEGGWVLTSDDQGRELVPVWPHAKYAEICANGVWSTAGPRSISLDAWLARWLPGITRDHRGIAVFPTPNNRAVAVDADRLSADIEEELANYE